MCHQGWKRDPDTVAHSEFVFCESTGFVTHKRHGVKMHLPRDMGKVCSAIMQEWGKVKIITVQCIKGGWHELCPPYPFKMKLLILRRIAWKFMAKTWWPAKRWASIVMPCKGCLPLLKDSVLLIVKEPKRTAATVSNILPWFISRSGQFPFSNQIDYTNPDRYNI